MFFQFGVREEEHLTSTTPERPDGLLLVQTFVLFYAVDQIAMLDQFPSVPHEVLTAATVVVPFLGRFSRVVVQLGGIREDGVTLGALEGRLVVEYAVFGGVFGVSVGLEVLFGAEELAAGAAPGAFAGEDVGEFADGADNVEGLEIGTGAPCGVRACLGFQSEHFLVGSGAVFEEDFLVLAG